MEYLINTDKCVTGFFLDKNSVDYVSNRNIYKMDRKSGNIIKTAELFKKEGFARDLLANNELLFIKDFCSLHIVNKHEYNTKKVLELGTDLRSDICGMVIDEKNIYVCIRNGSITVIDMNEMEIKGNYQISNGSFWDIHVFADYLVGGNVNGELIFIDKKSMKIKDTIILNNQNIHNIVIDNNLIYAAGINKTIYIVDANQFNCINKKRNVHRKMFNCVGVYKKDLITVSYPCSEISFWNKETLEHKKTINIPLNLFGRTYIEKNKLYISSKNIMGIVVCNLE